MGFRSSTRCRMPSGATAPNTWSSSCSSYFTWTAKICGRRTLARDAALEDLFADYDQGRVRLSHAFDADSASVLQSACRLVLCLLSSLPVRGLLRPIPADRHAAPPSHTTSSSIDEQKRAGRPLASLHVGEVLCAYKVCQRLCYRKEQRFR